MSNQQPNYPQEYTERESAMRINEFEAATILEESQIQLAMAQTEFIRITHNLQAVIENVEKAIVKLMGGDGE